MKKMTQSRQIMKNFFPNFQIFMISSSRYPRIWKDSFFLLSYLVRSQIWLNYFVNDRDFDYITKSLNQTLLQYRVQ
jgi:hypothetical protein